MSQSGGKRKTKVVKRSVKRTVKPTRRPTRTIKRKSEMATASGNQGKFIRSPLMDMPPHVQMDTDNPISAYLADYYMNTDIEKLSRKMFGAAIDEVYNKHKIVVGRAQPTAPSSATPSSTSSRTASSTSTSTSTVEKARPAPLTSSDETTEYQGFNIKRDGLVQNTHDPNNMLPKDTEVYCKTDGTYVFPATEDSILHKAKIVDNTVYFMTHLPNSTPEREYKIEILTGKRVWKGLMIDSVHGNNLYIKPKDHPGYNANTKTQITDSKKVLKNGDIVYVRVSEEKAGTNILRKAEVITELSLVNDDKTYTLKILDGPKKGETITQGVTDIYQ